MDFEPFFNEMYDAEQKVRPHCAAFKDWMQNTPPEKITQNREAALELISAT